MARGEGRKAQERRAEVRRLLERMIPEYKVYAIITEKWECSERTVRRDIEKIAEAMREEMDSEEVLELIAGTSFESMRRIAFKAEESGNLHAAIRAHATIIKMVGIRTRRWRHRRAYEEPIQESARRKPAPEEVQVAARVAELSKLSREERQAHLDRLAKRHLRLATVDGERVDEPPPAGAEAEQTG